MRSWLLLAALFGAGGCSGGTAEPVEEPRGPSVTIPDALMAQSWPMVMADESLLTAYSSQPGWISLVTKGDVRAAVEQLGLAGGLAAARAHAEAAAMFQQAALLSATAAQQTYGGSPRDTDALGAQHLVVLGLALNGERQAAQTALQTPIEGLGDAQPYHDVWRTWILADTPFPPDLSALGFGLPEVAVGQWPSISTQTHYALEERVQGGSPLEVTDPTALVALALWHQAAAELAAGDAKDSVAVFGARYRFMAQPAPVDPQPLVMDLLFGSDMLTPADGPFLAALTGEAGVAAIDTYKADSLLAALAKACRPDGELSVDLAQDAAAYIRQSTLSGLEQAAGGNTLSHHRVFADIVSVGVLRTLALVAEAEGNHEGAGILLINAMERSSSEYTADPKALLFLSTWDAHNRYPVRGTEILHNLIRRYPNLEAARFGLDALTLRESRSRGSQNPGL